MKINLLVGGPIENYPEGLLEKRGQDELWVGADKGAVRLCEAGIKPLLSIGDFDSSTNRERYLVDVMSREVMTSVPEKDDTDTESAVQTAAELGAEEIHIVGGTGSRLDHMLANVYLLGLLREEGISAYLVDAHNRVQVIDQRTVIKRETQYGKYVSLLPFMGAVEGITLKGMKYPLEDYILDHCHSIGISNEITGEQAEIEFRTGRLIVIESKD